MPENRSVVLGIDDHNGWANIISVCVQSGTPKVIENRWVSLLDEALPNQPYHHETLDMDEESAESLVAKVMGSALGCATAELKYLFEELRANFSLVGIALRNPPLAELPKRVKDAHATRSVMFSADAMLYHHALVKAARQMELAVYLYDRKKVMEHTAGLLGITHDEFNKMLSNIGKKHGTAWRKEHQIACAGAIQALMKL